MLLFETGGHAEDRFEHRIDKAKRRGRSQRHVCVFICIANLRALSCPADPLIEFFYLLGAASKSRTPIFTDASKFDAPPFDDGVGLRAAMCQSVIAGRFWPFAQFMTVGLHRQHVRRPSEVGYTAILDGIY